MQEDFLCDGGESSLEADVPGIGIEADVGDREVQDQIDVVVAKPDDLGEWGG